MAAAIADAAERAKVDPAEVVIAAWSPVTLNDGSLGCPKKGMGYTQALVEGELLLLRVDTALFQYHARTGGPFAYCANPLEGLHRRRLTAPGHVKTGPTHTWPGHGRFSARGADAPG